MTQLLRSRSRLGYKAIEYGDMMMACRRLRTGYISG